MKNEIEFQNALIEERSQGIKEIEKTVVEVNEIFRDLSTIVAEQGSMIGTIYIFILHDLLDSIESNIEDAVDNTKVAVEELGQASKHQKKSRTKLCFILLLVVIILAAVVFAIWFFAIRKSS